MSNFYYTVQLDVDESPVVCKTPEEVFNLLKKKNLISVLRYNDSKTTGAYVKQATKQELDPAEFQEVPVCVVTALSDVGVFVESEDFWIENYMFDEFYNPERMPYVEKLIRHENEVN